MEKIFKELAEQNNIRANLSSLRQMIKDAAQKAIVLKKVKEQEGLFVSFLQNEDAKTRKNAVLLFGDLAYQDALEALYEAYVTESTLFVKASYLQAMAELDAKEKVSAFKEKLEQLLETEPEVENKKHVEEEIRALRKLVIQAEGISHHTPDIEGKRVTVLLFTNRTQRETIRRTIDCGEASVHPLGVLVETEDLESLMKLRTYREMTFPLDLEGYLSDNPVEAARAIWESDIIGLLNSVHKEQGAYYFRIECKSAMDLEKRSVFTKKLAAELESLSKGQLVNSTSDYEVEIRLIANRDGLFFPCLRLFTLKNPRFDYRKNAIAASIHPSTAALIMELAKDYLKEDAQIMDPFCGVGTMLIERNKKVPAREMYGTDIYGEAIAFARENTQMAGARINYIHRDFFDFKHEYLFNEIVTNMPLRGQKTKQEMDAFYGAFFEKAKQHLTKDAVIVMYTNEIGFVKKQLRLHKEFSLLQETCLQPKNDFYLLIMGYKG